MADVPAPDKWNSTIFLLTGYQLPKRDEIFNKLYGNDNTPLMKFEINAEGTAPSDTIAQAVQDTTWLRQNSGWRIENTDIVVPFYGKTDGSANSKLPVGTEVKMYRARITLLGTDADHSMPAGMTGAADPGATFGSSSSPLMDGAKNGDGSAFSGWDSRPVSQYSYGGGLALEQLLNKPYSTQDFAWNGIRVEDANAVDLAGFDRAALAFNRAANFFRFARQTIQQWQTALGTEDASWRGEAAGVFYDLIQKLGLTYQGYTDALPTGGPGISKVAIELEAAKQAYINAITNLHAAWHNWALYMGNPLRWLVDLLADITYNIWRTNIATVRYHIEYYGGNSQSDQTQHKDEKLKTATADWSGDAVTSDGKMNFGPLNDKSTWRKIGEEAVARWKNSVKENLDTAAEDAMTYIRNAWVSVPKSLPQLSTPSFSLAADYQADAAAAQQDKMDKQNAANQAKSDELEKKQEEWRKQDQDRADAAAAASAA
ncbi:AAWKG family protein, partial [Actinoallomurus spadix]